MKQPDIRSHLPSPNVHRAWQQQLRDQRDAKLAEDLKRREQELLPRFGEYYQRLHALPRRWRRGIGRRLRLSLAGVALLLALGHGAAFAAIINVDGTTCTLADAITAANTDTATGGCPAGNGVDTLNLQTDVTLFSELPSIVSGVTIEGNGNTIQRDDGAPQFNVLNVDGAYYGELTLNDATISGGTAGIHINDNGIVTEINGSTISGNSRGVYTRYGRNSITITNSDISNNGDWGIIVSCNVTVSNSSISGNGSGVLCDNFSTSQIKNSTIVNNSFYGVINDYGCDVLIEDSTISGNRFGVGEGVGINAEYRTMTISRTIISGNTIHDIGDNYGIDANDHNLFGDSSKTNAQAFENFTPGPTDITATSDGTNPTALKDILETTLVNNGGSTKTLALVEGSPAVDAAGPDCPPPDTDQRGFPRPQGGACDIGAFEGVVGIVNDHVTFVPDPSSYQTTRDTEGCPPNYWGKYLFEAWFSNVDSQPLTALSVGIDKLTRKNVLLAPDGTLLGEGDRLPVPREGEYSDELLETAEKVAIPFEICLEKKRSFQFFVDAYGSGVD